MNQTILLGSIHTNVCEEDLKLHVCRTELVYILCPSSVLKQRVRKRFYKSRVVNAVIKYRKKRSGLPSCRITSSCRWSRMCRWREVSGPEHRRRGSACIYSHCLPAGGTYRVDALLHVLTGQSRRDGVRRTRGAGTHKHMLKTS